MIENVLGLVVGGLGLFFGGSWLVKGASRLAMALGVSALIVGLTVVALGTSAPELLVSLTAALEASSDVALGNVVGSNIANIGLILAVSALITPMVLDWRVLRREIVFLLAFTIFSIIMSVDGSFSRIDGVVLVLGYIVYTAVIYRQARSERREIEPELTEYEAVRHLTDRANPLIEAGRALLGLVTLVIGARLFVGGAVGVAREIGLSELIIGVTLVAVGTSLPELITCIIAAQRREHDIVMGNILGSNIANLLVILGIVAIIQPIPVPVSVQSIDYPVMLFFAVLLLPMALRRRLHLWGGLALLVLYGAFILLSLSRS
jgi:cation:H+ antiporter